MSLFRELFVEVPQALLEASVRAAEEAKLKASAFTVTTHETRFIIDLTTRALSMIRPRETVLEYERSAIYEHTYLKVRLPCGHRGRYVIDEMEIQINSSFADYMYDLFAQGPARKCTCLYREQAGCAFSDGLTFYDRCKGCQ